MTPNDPASDLEAVVGLCARCRHSRRIETPRSTFWLCRRAATDPSFEKYPRLPIRECPGFEAGPPDPDGE